MDCEYIRIYLYYRCGDITSSCKSSKVFLREQTQRIQDAVIVKKKILARLLCIEFSSFRLFLFVVLHCIALFHIFNSPQ